LIVTVASVPEPATAAFSMLGLASFLVMRRKQQSL
jgi:PEP-CTERM motif